MEKLKQYQHWLSMIVVVILVLIDQWIKYLVVEYLMPVHEIPLWQDVFHLTYVENRGAAFGIFTGQKFILIGVTGVVMIGLIGAILLKKIKAPFLIWTFCLIVGGGIGNLIDRALLGYVIDYLDFTLIDFAVFNFADCCVVVGVFLFAIYSLIIEPRMEKKNALSA